MGFHAFQFHSQYPIPVSHNYHGFINDNFTISRTCGWRCFSGGRSGGSRWDWYKTANPNRGSRFNDAYATDEYDEEDEFGFRNSAKQRVWWSDDLYAENDEDDQGFGNLEASIVFNWVPKVFRAFGWMIPAVMISLLMGTGPNAIIMTLALPLAQSALSLAADTLWGRVDETTLRPKSKSKKRPRTRMRKEKECCTQTRKQAGNYKSWFEASDVESNEMKNGQKFGGWDELDSQVRRDEESRTTPLQGNKPSAEERVKISMRIKGDSPLFMRLLIATFPYLRFWTKLF